MRPGSIVSSLGREYSSQRNKPRFSIISSARNRNSVSRATVLENRILVSKWSMGCAAALVYFPCAALRFGFVIIDRRPTSGLKETKGVKNAQSRNRDRSGSRGDIDNGS